MLKVVEECVSGRIRPDKAMDYLIYDEGTLDEGGILRVWDVACRSDTLTAEEKVEIALLVLVSGRYPTLNDIFLPALAQIES
jgi:hypothetical protein